MCEIGMLENVLNVKVQSFTVSLQSTNSLITPRVFPFFSSRGDGTVGLSVRPVSGTLSVRIPATTDLSR